MSMFIDGFPLNLSLDLIQYYLYSICDPFVEKLGIIET